MEARLEKIENSEAYISVEIDAEQFEEGLQKAYLKVVKEVSLPGFRKGRIPRQLLEARFGTEILYQDAVEYIVPKAYAEALKKLELEPIAQPIIDIEEIDSKEAFSFKARIPVKPDVILGEMEGIEISIPSFEVNDQDVEDKIKEMQERYARLEEKTTDEPAENGDTVYHDFEGFTDGVAFAGGKGENYPLELGSDTFIPGYEEQVVGVKVGEDREIKVYFPEDYKAEDLAGKEAVFKIKVNKIETKVPRELDDDFVQEISEYDTVEDLRTGMKNELLEEADAKRRNIMRKEVLNEGLKRCEILVAEAVIREQTRVMLRQLEYTMAAQGIDIKQYMQISGNNEDMLLESFYPEAEHKIKCDFMMEKLIEEKGIDVTSEEINKHIEEVSKNTGMSFEEAEERIYEVFESVALQIKVDKALDLLLETAVITDKVPETEVAQENPDSTEAITE